MRLLRLGWTRALPSSTARRDGFLLLALLVVVISVSRAYVANERWFYYWDQAVHQDIAWQTARAFGESWHAGLIFVVRSFNDDYNALFALPLLPFLCCLGVSRLAFVTALSIVGLCPLALSLGLLATRIVTGPRRAVVWAGAWLALLVPLLWVPTLRGFPDALPASLVILALSIVLSERGLQWLRGAALSGALLAVAAILRRHFAYAGLALFETVALYGLARVAFALFARSARWRGLAREVLLWLVVAGTAASGTLLTVGHGFLRRVIAIDFSVLYKSYENAVVFVLLWFLGQYSWPNLVFASVGLLLGLFAGIAHRDRTIFLMLFSVISGVQWLLLVRQLGEQYTLHFTPIVVMGLVMLAWVLWRHASRASRPVLVVAGGVWLVTNSVFTLSTLKTGKDAVWRSLFATQWEPLRRYDYNAVLDLVQVLGEYGPPKARVYVAASSHVINPDIVRHADWAQRRHSTGRLAVLRVPELDARDEYPVDALVGADMVVTADPPQYHLSPREQTTVRVAHDIFTLGVAVAHDFERLPAVFPLIDGVAVTVFKRIRPTDPDTALETLRIAKEYTPHRPGMQSDWVVVGGPFPSWLVRLPDGTATWTAHPTPRGYLPVTTAATVEQAPAVAQVSGEVAFVDARCPGTTLAFFGKRTAGRPWPLAEVRRRPGEDGRFLLQLDSRGADRLMLNLLNYTDDSSFDHCLLKVHLVLQAGRAPTE